MEEKKTKIFEVIEAVVTLLRIFKGIFRKRKR